MYYFYKPGSARLVWFYKNTILCCVLLLCACDRNTISAVPPITPSENLPGGDTSVGFSPIASFELPANNLPGASKPKFHAGKALANQPWIKAPATTTARDGLGPIYNARSCLACHINGGKGSVPLDNTQAIFSALVRTSIPGQNAKLGANPEPTYGDQLQTQSVALSHQLRNLSPEKIAEKDVAPEAYIYLQWQNKIYQYPDGQRTQLRWPELDIRHLAYGEFAPDALFSLRVAPTIHGMGLLERIAKQDLEDLTDENDRNNNGISGRANYVWDNKTHTRRIGRFGYKANRASLDMAVAGAFANDLGISNPLFPMQPCGKSQTRCIAQINGNDEDGFELPQHLLDLVINFNRNLGVPKRRNVHDKNVLEGRTLFYRTGCQLCHQPSFVTISDAKYPHLSQQKIWPYTDLLLHDMGEYLADGRPDYLATGREWRTPPLWSIGLNKRVNGSTALLHDGRAQNIEEAILWHGGEAEAIKQNFANLRQPQREQLIKFVGSL